MMMISNTFYLSTIVRAFVLSMFMLSVGEYVYAQDQENANKAMEQQMLEMIKASGLDPAQAAQVEAMISQGAADVRDKDRIELDQKKAEFAAQHGTQRNASLELDGETHLLTTTQCAWTDAAARQYQIGAETPPGEHRLGVYVRGGAQQDAYSFVTLLGTAGDQEEFSIVGATYDGDRFEWSGTAKGLRGQGKVDVQVRISALCN